MSRGGWAGNRKSREQRFHEKYSIDHESGCWNWIGKKDKDGYGKVCWGDFYRAHRWSYANFNGKMPDGMCVCHTCDNPSCVNPNHLWLGTNADNMKDRNSKGRQASGARLRPDTVPMELAMHALKEVESGRTQKSVAEETGIDQTTVSRIFRRKTWHFSPQA